MRKESNTGKPATKAIKARKTPAEAKAEPKAQTPATAAPQPTQAKAKKAPAAPKPKKVSGLDAAALVLKNVGKPMHCKDIVETMLGKGLWKTGGKTPAATIYAAILREITAKGNAARFKKTDRGLFASSGK
jgi:restriction system protein